MLKIIDTTLMIRLCSEAAVSPRKRVHHNLHPHLEDPIQRLCIALQPGSYIRPHSHEDKWEMFTILKGQAAVLLFDEKGTVTERSEMLPDSGSVVVEIPPKVFHTFVILASDTVMIELKPGPYKKPTEKDFAPWSPAEGTAETSDFEIWLKTTRVGSNKKQYK